MGFDDTRYRTQFAVTKRNRTELTDNSPVPGGYTDTTYFVYIDDSGNEGHDVLTAIAVPAPKWAETLQTWKKFRRWVYKKYQIPPSVELHALDLGTNSKRQIERTDEGDVFHAEYLPLAHLDPLDPALTAHDAAPSIDESSVLEVFERNQISKSAFTTLANGMPWLRVLTVYKPVASGSGSLYEPLIKFVDDYCGWHKSFAVIWFDGTAPSLHKVTRGVHRGLSYDRRVLEDARGYSSADSHFIQMADFVAYSAHHAVLNDLRDRDSTAAGPKPSGQTYLRNEAYQTLLRRSGIPGLVWPGAKDKEDFPVFGHRLGIRGYPA